MRILHLAYEDPAQPGSGGGAIRTREINRRLSQNHEITALVAGYPGATERVEDGIHWIPIGLQSKNHTLNRLSYFAVMGAKLRQHQFDLLVEDFGAPFSTGLSPLFTKKPVVAMVQWMFAREMREKYHLPFDWVERFGLRYYDDFIAVSDWLAADIQSRRPGVTVEAIPNGVEELAFSVTTGSANHLLFVGRLDIKQKGCEMMLDAVAAARRTLGDRLPPLRIVGDGPDQGVLEQQAQRLGISQRVEFCGRVSGKDKYQLMADSTAVLMPSRFETFGMVAVEAQAAGAPVIAFDVGPLADVAGPGGARLVDPFDVSAFTQQIVDLVENPAKVAALRQSGREWARRYNWDALAAQQEAHYLRSVESKRSK